jgi:hypothetical protein
LRNYPFIIDKTMPFDNRVYLIIHKL